MPQHNKAARFKGEVQFDTPRQVVWQFITNPSLVSRCVPGLTHWEEIIPNQQFHLVVAWITQTKSNIKFPISLTWDSIEPPCFLSITATSHAKSMNQLRLEGEIHLAEQGDNQAVLEFTAVIHTQNPFFDHLIRNILPKQIDQFFIRVKNQLKKTSPNS